jgi:hypothetical protein
MFSLAPAARMCPSAWPMTAMPADVFARPPQSKGGVAQSEIAPAIFLAHLVQCLLTVMARTIVADHADLVADAGDEGDLL